MDTTLLRRNLAVIGKVKTGDKVLVQGGLSFDISQSSSKQPIVRWAYGESREMSCESIRFVLGCAFVTLTLCDTDDPYDLVAERPSVKEGIVKDLIGAMAGLKNLSQTYRNDVRVSLQFDSMLEGIRSFLQRRADITGEVPLDKMREDSEEVTE